MQQKKYAVIDLETTGFSSVDRVLEIGVVLADGAGQIERRWGTLIQPERDIPNSFVHGITASDLVEAPCFAGIALELAELLDGRTVVAHNAGFDTRMLMNEFRRLGVVLADAPEWSLCTMRWSSRALPGRPQKLKDCLDVLGISNEQAHSALGDATATAQLLAKLLENADRAPLASSIEFAEEDLERLAELQQDNAVPRERARSEAVGSWVKRLVQNTPRSEDEALARYRDLLAAALLDKVLSATEIKQLAECAAAEGLSIDDVTEIHREFLGQIAVEAWADGVVTPEEEATLRRIGAQLDVPSGDVDKLLAQPTTGETLSFELRYGQRVSFTGSMELGRTTWETRAKEAGLEVGSVTKNTVLLVAANPDSMSSKARRARELRIPIVNEKTFSLLVGNLRRSVPDGSEQRCEAQRRVEESMREALTHSPDKELATVFPWFDPMLSESTVNETAIAARWRDRHESSHLHELSPFLSNKLPDSLGISPLSQRTWLTRHPEPLEASLVDLYELRGFGKVKVNKILVDLVLDAIDSHQAARESDLDEYGFESDVYLDSQRSRRKQQAEQENSELKRRIAGAVQAWDVLAMWLSKELVSAPAEVCQAARVLDELDGRAIGELTARKAVASVEDAVGSNTRDREIFIERTFGTATLESLGQQYGVTRERIRQLEREITNRISMSSGEVHILTSVLLKHVHTPARRSEILQSLPYFSSAGPFGRGDLLGYVLSRTPSLIDDQWIEPVGFSEDLANTIARFATEYGVASLVAVSAQLGMDKHQLRERIEWQYPNYIWLNSETFLTQVSSHQDRACGVLAHSGQPLSISGICEQLGHDNLRSVSNQLSTDPRAIRVGKDEWALEEWGYEEYSSISDWITKKINEGPVTLQQLLDEAESLGVSQNSVRSYASGDRFVNEGGYLRLSTSEDLTVDKDAQPAYAKHLYQLADGWAYVFTVTHDHLRGSGATAPKDLIRLLNVPPLSSVTLYNPELGEIKIYRSATTTNMGTIRTAIGIRNLVKDQRAILVAREDHTFDLRSATEIDENLGGIPRVLNELGLDGEFAGEDPLIALATALFLGPGAARRKVVRALRERKLDTLADIVANES